MKRFLTRLSMIPIALTITMTASAVQTPVTPGQDRKFIDQLYQDLLGRNPSRGELSLLQAMLNAGAPRAQAAGAITSSNEYRSNQVRGYFNAFLNRPATASEVTLYLNFLQNGANDD